MNCSITKSIKFAVIAFMLFQISSQCGMEFAGPTQSLMTKRIYESTESNSQKRNLQLVPTDVDPDAPIVPGCDKCFKFKFDFFKINNPEFDNYRVIINMLRYILDDTLKAPNFDASFLTAFNNLIYSRDKSMFDLNGKDCYNTGYQLSPDTLNYQLFWDFFFIPMIDPTLPQDKMYTKYCYQDTVSRRPIMAIIAFSDKFMTEYNVTDLNSFITQVNLKDKGVVFNKLFNRILHQIIHMLGFHIDLFPQFKDSNGSIKNIVIPVDYMRTKINAELQSTSTFNVYEDETLTQSTTFPSDKAGKSHLGIFDKDVGTAARIFYGCNSNDIVLPLEKLGGLGNANNHWDASLLLGDIMTMDTDFPELFISPMTMAVIYTTNWYNIGNTIHGGRYSFGKLEGCDFIKGNFLTQDKPNFLPFCYKSDTGCSPNLTAKGTCNIAQTLSDPTYTQAELKLCLKNKPNDKYTLFSSKTKGGTYCLNKNVPFYYPQTFCQGMGSTFFDNDFISNRSVPRQALESSGSACFYYTKNINTDKFNGTGDTTQFDFSFKSGCFKYICDVPNLLTSVCVFDTATNADKCFQCKVIDNNIDGGMFATIGLNDTIGNKIYESRILCPPFEKICGSYCRTIYDCIGLNPNSFTDKVTSDGKLNNKVMQLKLNGLIKCCTPNTTTNCSTSIYCLPDSYYGINLLPCCNSYENNITNCSTFDSCAKPKTGFPCTTPFKMSNTSSYLHCKYPLPFCVKDQWSVDCVKDGNEYGYALPIIRKCTNTILSNCALKKVNTNLNNFTPPCNNILSTNCYQSSKTPTYSVMPQCDDDYYKRNMNSFPDGIYYCSNRLASPTILKDVGIEFNRKYNVECNEIDVSTNCISTNLKAYAGFYHKGLMYFKCAAGVTSECFADSSPIAQSYGLFKPYFCCTGPLKAWCIICTGNSSQEVPLPYLPSCATDSNATCYYYSASYPVPAKPIIYKCFNIDQIYSNIKCIPAPISTATNLYCLYILNRANKDMNKDISCTNYSDLDKCCKTQNSTGCTKSPNKCVIEIKKCKLLTNSSSPDECIYDFSVNDGSCTGTQYNEYCYNVYETVKYCCPTGYSKAFSITNCTSTSINSNLVRPCDTLLKPCCLTNLSLAYCEDPTLTTCTYISPRKDPTSIYYRFVSESDPVITACNLTTIGTISEDCLMYLHTSQVSPFDSYEQKLYMVPAQLINYNISNANINSIGKVQIKNVFCCGDNRKENCYWVLSSKVSNYCVLIQVESLPKCGTPGLMINLNCNSANYGSNNDVQPSNVICCDKDFTKIDCVNSPNCITPPCCDTKLYSTSSNYDGITIFHTDGTTETNTNCVTQNVTKDNCYVMNICCDISRRSLPQCVFSPICFPPLPKCDATQNLFNCVNGYQNAASLTLFIDNQTWNILDLVNNKSICMGNADFKTLWSSSKFYYNTVEPKVCFTPVYSTIVPYGCGNTWTIISNKKDCIYAYNNVPVAPVEGLCCDTSNTNECFNTSDQSKCSAKLIIPPCCYPLINVTSCSYNDACVTKLACCSGRLGITTNCTNPNTDSSNCVAKSIKCNSYFNQIGQCQNNSVASIDAVYCTSEIVDYCLYPKKCCDNYIYDECHNIENCLKPLPSCDVNRGKGSTMFSISDDVPCITTTNTIVGFQISSKYSLPPAFNEINSRFPIIPCCLEQTHEPDGCMHDLNYCIPEMKCCFKTVITTGYVKNKSFIFEKNCSNLQNCYEAGPCLCNQNNRYTESKCYGELFIVDAVNDSRYEFCYPPLPVCPMMAQTSGKWYFTNYDEMYDYSCCDTSAGKTSNCIYHSTCLVLKISDFNSLTACTLGGNTNCYSGLNKMSLVWLNCCTNVDMVDCYVSASCSSLKPFYFSSTGVKNVSICVYEQLETECYRKRCEPNPVKGIPNRTYPCCSDEIQSDCSTLENCVPVAPCFTEKYLYGEDDTKDPLINPEKYHPVNSYSTFSNCFKPLPCCESYDPPSPPDCNISEPIGNTEALIRNDILLEAYSTYGSKLYNTIANVNLYYSKDIGKTIKQLKQEGKVHQCIASDYKKQYPCCSDDDPNIKNWCHTLKNCIQPKKCKIDIYGNNYNFSDDTVINEIIEDPRNCFRPRHCCNPLYDSTKCTNDPVRCIPIAAPCCGTGVKTAVVTFNCHSLPNCIFPLPCCITSVYSLQLGSAIPDNYPKICNNLLNCYIPKPCCNLQDSSITISYASKASDSNSSYSNANQILNFNLKNPFALVPGSTFDDSNLDCRNNYGTRTDEIVIVKKVSAYPTPPLSGDDAACIKSIRCCDSNTFNLCHKFKNCYGYATSLTTTSDFYIQDLPCCTSETQSIYQCTKALFNPFCIKGKPCCNNPNMASLDPKIYDCDSTMSLISNNYNPNSTSNCIRTIICCSPDYTTSCSWEINCFPKAFPKKTSNYKYSEAGSPYNGVSTSIVNSYTPIPCCDPGTDSTISKPCSTNKSFCIPKLPCCSDAQFIKNTLTTTRTHINGCVEKSQFFNCQDVAPKCTADFKMDGCSLFYNAWDPQPCTLPSVVASADNTLTNYIYMPGLIASDYCIQPVSCCTSNYQTNCHNLSNCYPSDRLCIPGVYSQLNAIYRCTSFRNAFYPMPCCTDDLQVQCIPPNKDCLGDLTVECGCVPPLPCCDSKLKTNCHNLKNCIPKMPCCLYKSNEPLSYLDSITKVCKGCPNFTNYSTANSNVTCCTHISSDYCTIDYKKTLEFLLCKSNFPNTSVNDSITPCQVTVLPCCMTDSNGISLLVPYGCINDSTKCSIGTRPCCIAPNSPPGCSEDECVNYLPFCELIDSPLIKYDSCSNWSNCISYPKPCCVTNRDPKACTTNQNLFLSVLKSSLNKQNPCCIRNNVLNGPSECVINNFNNNCDPDFLPCCIDGLIDNPLGCVIPSSSYNCYNYLPTCKVTEYPLNCSEDKISCLPSLPCCSNRFPTNCTSMTSLYYKPDPLMYRNYPYCIREAPRCSSRYDKMDCEDPARQSADICCSKSFNSYTAVPCCDIVNLPDLNECSNDTETCIQREPCCGMNPSQTEKQACNSLANCVPPAPKCTDIYSIINHADKKYNCENKSNSFDPLACGTLASLSIDPNLNAFCIPPMPCCNPSDNTLNKQTNCHNLSNCTPPSYMCDCIKGRYLRKDCNKDSGLTPMPCCSSKKTGLTIIFSDNEKNTICSTNEGNCIKPGACCRRTSPFNIRATICNDSDLSDIKNQNCDNLENCIQAAPFCVQNQYMIKDVQNFKQMWNGKVIACVDKTNNANSDLFYEPYLCNDPVKIKTDSLFKERCIIKLPCCPIPSQPSQLFPCHNIPGCITQDNFCCVPNYKLNCVNLDVDPSDIVLPNIKNPANIRCKFPLPCCSASITTGCAQPNADPPTNCILPLPCCIGDQIDNCHNLANCKSRLLQ